jgi:sec-independent protein translocase protein TatA
MAITNFGELLGLGTPELLVILVILVLLFGANKLPQLSRSIGSSMRELRKGMQSDEDEKTTTTKDVKQATTKDL